MYINFSNKKKGSPFFLFALLLNTLFKCRHKALNLCFCFCNLFLFCGLGSLCAVGIFWIPENPVS